MVIPLAVIAPHLVIGFTPANAQPGNRVSRPRMNDRCYLVGAHSTNFENAGKGIRPNAFHW